MGYLAGSVGNIQTLYYLGDPNNTAAWSNFQNGEFVVVNAAQTEFSTFAKDEWKITRNFTLTPGLRWDYFGVPYLTSGLTVAPVDGGAGAFGISGRDFSGWMNPGARAAATSFELVGPDSPNPNKTAYPDNYHNFGPSLSFAWQLPWFGEGKTIVRGGYQITYQGGGRFGTVAPALASAPGSNFQASFTTQNVYLDLANLNASQVPVPNVQPLQPLLTTGPRSASYTGFDANYTNPYIQNISLQVTRSVARNVTVDVRYIGTLARKTYTQVNLNENNFLYNGLLDELSRVRTGTEITKVQGDPLSMLDRMFAGVNLCTGANCSGGTFGNIGTVAGGVYQTAAYQLRSNSTYQANLANGNFDAIAGSIANANGNLTVPTGTVGAALRLNGFADNYIKTNPQFNNMNLYTNSGYNNYHALQVEVTSRPVHGLSGQATYSWSKNLGLLGGTGQATQAGELTNPVERRVDYTNVNNTPGHSLRTNGLIELPMGPNKLFLGNASGWLARAVERWQLGLIYNLSSGYPTSITATTMVYGNGLPDVRHPVDFNKMKGLRWGIPAGTFLEGRYFDNGDTFVKVDDPVCDSVTTLQNLANVVGGVQTRCTLNALAMVVPAGTPDSFAELDANSAPTGRTLQVVLQHPQPGKRGNLGNSTIIGMGSWRFDANLSKTFRIDESKSLAVRIDMQNVLNHPQPSTAAGSPNFSITGNNPFGQVTTKTGTRLLQGQLRLNF
jgi:TonB dependent receptor